MWRIWFAWWTTGTALTAQVMYVSYFSWTSPRVVPYRQGQLSRQRSPRSLTAFPCCPACAASMVPNTRQRTTEAPHRWLNCTQCNVSQLLIHANRAPATTSKKGQRSIAKRPIGPYSDDTKAS